MQPPTLSTMVIQECGELGASLLIPAAITCTATSRSFRDEYVDKILCHVEETDENTENSLSQYNSANLFVIDLSS